MQNYFIYETRVGKITIINENDCVTGVLFGERPLGEMKETPLIRKTYGQLCEYFDGKRKVFDIPLNIKGTDFQKKVWHALTTIPYGKTWSYKELAVAIGNEKACRAVGMANNKNPIAIIVPCHRVVGANGKLVGYNGGLPIKKLLLDFESKRQV